MAALEAALFEDSTLKLRGECTRDEVSWPDVQAVFRHALRSVLGLAEWSEKEGTYPVLGKKVTLRLRVERGRIGELLLGEWRMYCKPPDSAAFSYGLVVTAFDAATMVFKAHPKVAGRYELVDGRVEYQNENGQQHVYIKYKEVAGDRGAGRGWREECAGRVCRWR